MTFLIGSLAANMALAVIAFDSLYLWYSIPRTFLLLPFSFCCCLLCQINTIIVLFADLVEDRVVAPVGIISQTGIYLAAFH